MSCPKKDNLQVFFRIFFLKHEFAKRPLGFPSLGRSLLPSRIRSAARRLARVLGDRNWEVAEDSVQAAMHEALRTWGPRGIPSDPGGWLYRVAHRKAIDHLRRTKLHQKFLDHEGIGMYQLDSRDLLVNENDQDTSIRDDRLRMLFYAAILQSQSILN